MFQIKSFSISNCNLKIKYQNWWDAARAVLRRKLIALSAYVRKKIDLKPITSASTL